MKVQSPNYSLILKSAIASLQDTYAAYKKAITKNLSLTWYSDDGTFTYLAGIEERTEHIKELEKEIIRLQFKIEEIKGLMEREVKDGNH